MTISTTDSNKDVYNSLGEGEYASIAPHLRHKTIADLYVGLLRAACAAVVRKDGTPFLALDLGAGEGTVTRPLLELGARVLAVDISERQLAQLRSKCEGFGACLEVRCVDINSVLEEERCFDLIVANSLLHHIPDYLDLIRRATARLSVGGVFVCFQDPMWKRTISRRDAFLSWFAYTGWRLGQGDIAGGVWRRLRRMCGYYSAVSLHDNTEYHAVRDGVNQEAICAVLAGEGFECEVLKYCSFHGDAWQAVGERLGVVNTFGLLATRKCVM